MREVPEEQILTRIRTENPWWETGEVPQTMARLRPRPYLDLFFPLVSQREVRRGIVLLGPRRVGKTVLLHHAIQRLLQQGATKTSIAYFSVDHPLYNGLSLESFLRYFREATGTDFTSTPTYVFFDEIQYLRDWEVHLKALVDDFEPLRAIGSGSAAAALRLKSRESGAGRFTDFLLPPLTFHEYLELLDKSDVIRLDTGGELVVEDLEELNRDFVHYLNFGGYPEVLFSEAIQSDPVRFIKADIIDKVLLRDLPSLYGIQDIQELNYLFTTLAYNTAGEVSLDELSKGAGVAKNTIKRYMEYLEAAFLIKVVHRVDRNGRRFKRANFFKVYLTNPSMRAALFAPVEAEDPAMGALVETAIFAQWFHEERSELHYARWSKGEVDLVPLDAAGKARGAIEAKWSDRYFAKPQELRSLLRFCRANDLRRASATTRSKSGKKTAQGVEIDFIPAAVYCFRIGSSILGGKYIETVLAGRFGPRAPLR